MSSEVEELKRRVAALEEGLREIRDGETSSEASDAGLDEWLLCVAMMEVIETQGQRKPPKDWSWRQTANAVKVVYARLQKAKEIST